MYKDIISAINYLPEDLINDQIVEAGLAKGDIKLLNILPEKYLTPSVVTRIIEKNAGYCSFDLSRISSDARTKSVCELAVKKKIDNFRHVPISLRSATMLECLMDSAKNALSLLPLVPIDLWNTDAVYKGIRSLYSATEFNSYSYSRRQSYHSGSISQDACLRMVQALLSYVPRKFKNQRFYLGLFDQKMPVKDVLAITPNKYKQTAFYRYLAQKDFKSVPPKHYSYDLLLASLRSSQGVDLSDIFSPSSYGEDTRSIARIFLSLMDDTMADAIVDRDFRYFKSLPDRFRTESRLMRAIALMQNNHGSHLIDEEKDHHLLTPTVCRAFVKKNMGYPTFPAYVWNKDFVCFCIENGPSFDWFEQMPGHLQTVENTALAMDKYQYYVRYVRPEFITLERAKAIYRQDVIQHPREEIPPYEKYIPHHYLAEFSELTGLPRHFFGGETTLLDMREAKERYSFCRMGDVFLGIYSKDGYIDSRQFLIMTRRTPDAIRPRVIFDRPIGTFHITWLEKMVADYDRTFVRPTVCKKLKDLQVNTYYGLEFVENRDGVEIYRNTFLGGVVCYTARHNGKIVRADTREDLFHAINRAA